MGDLQEFWSREEILERNRVFKKYRKGREVIESDYENLVVLSKANLIAFYFKKNKLYAICPYSRLPWGVKLEDYF